MLSYADVGNTAVSLRQSIRKPFKTPFLNPRTAKSAIGSDVSSAAVRMQPPPAPSRPPQFDAPPENIDEDDDEEIHWQFVPSPPSATDKGKGKAKAPNAIAIELDAGSSDTISRPDSKTESTDLTGQRARKRCRSLACVWYLLTAFLPA